MKLQPDDPLTSYPLEVQEQGPVGWIENLDWEQEGDRLLFSFERDLLPGIWESGVAVYLFEDGTFHERIHGDVYEYVFPAEKDRVALDFYLLPDDEHYESWPHIPNWVPQNRVVLTWSIDGPARMVQVAMADTLGGLDYTDPVEEFLEPVATITRLAGTNTCEVSGKWVSSDIYAEIDIEITNNGPAGYAKYSIDYDGVVTTGHEVEARRTPLLNGLYVKFSETEDYAIGDKWRIRVGLPERWESMALSDGTHYVGVRSVNCGGAASTPVTGSFSTNLPPNPVTITDTEWDSVNGEFTVTFLSPSDADLDYATLYRNRIGEDGELEGMVHWLPEQVLGVNSSTSYQFVITDLSEGENLFLIRLTDTGGMEERNLNFIRLVLDGSNNEVGEPNPPVSLEVKCEEGVVMVYVWLDDTADQVKIYSDGTTGTIDYGTPIKTIASTGGKKLNLVSGTLSLVSDGVYTFGARAWKGASEEKNTDVIAIAELYVSTPTAVTDLVIDVVK